MNLPIQREPVQRTSLGQAALERGERAGTRLSTASESYGVQPSGILDDIQKAVGIAGQVGGMLGPIFGGI